MSIYLVNAIVGLIIVILGFSSARAGQNVMLGARFPATYASSDVWRKTNQRLAQITYGFCPAFILVNLFFYLIAAPDKYGYTLTYCLAVAAAILCVYLYFYSRRLLRTVSLPLTDNTIGTSKSDVILHLGAAIAFIIVGILLIFSHAGTAIGIRVGNVFRDAETWHKVNVIGGLGDVVVGTFFALDFARFISSSKSAKAFYRTSFTFIVILALWILFSAVYAYHA